MSKLNRLLLAFFGLFMSINAFSAPVTQGTIATARNAGTLQESWISGSSAATYNIFIGFSIGCDRNTLAVFNSNQFSNASRPGSYEAGNFLAYACIRAGKVSVVYHTIDGGSFNAYSPHIPNDVDGDGVFSTTNLRRIRKLDSNSACVAQTGTLSLPNQTAIPSYRACFVVIPATSPDGAIALPAGGFSDVEAAMFGISTDVYGTEVNANVGQVFGIATSTSLYRGMQVAQGIYSSEQAAATADPNFLPINAPSISKAQYVSLITGSTQSWKDLVPNSTKTVQLIQYVPTSGMQAVSNIYFLNNPCNSNSMINGSLFPVRAYDSTTSFIVREVTSANIFKKALTSNNEFAIGLLSLENDWRIESPSNQANGYRFIKLDGTHPEASFSGSGQQLDSKARYTAAQGQNDLHMELKFFVADSAKDTFGERVFYEIAGFEGFFAGESCVDLPRGLTINPFAGSSCTFGQVVAKGTRSVNSCQPQLLY